ncbi:hypothetical protein SAMN02745116_01922 [Pilibacter termitis]|uniref:SMODS and SLOG-associating 2TM effector domain-containing protein n=1 Tax=Pilibacter termitis TaxID=263852 RepID=A0A1T4PUQ3_9ENTE|nr:SLATT domain-containing protein [Pilibacter termitis]SJZ94668.1 hypothetical protein SAMN02745116_01922 [Pilibacter termitis]
MDLREKLHGDLKDFIVNVGWTHKIHIVQSDRLFFWSNVLKVVQVVSSAITASGLIAIVLGKGSFGFNLAVAVVSFITLAVNGFDKAMDLGKIAIKEKQDANNFWKLREQARMLLSAVQFQTDEIENINSKYDDLIELRMQYNDDLLNVPKHVVNKSSELIKECKDNDYSEDYQYFIPEKLMELKEENK